MGFWPPQDYVVLDTEAPLTCFLLGWWYGCYMWLDFCSQISLFLTLKKKITLKLDTTGHKWWQCPHQHRCTENLVWGLWPYLYLRRQAAASISLPSPATPSVIPWGKLREPSLWILEALQGSLQDCMNLNNSWELCLQLTRTREIA